MCNVYVYTCIPLFCGGAPTPYVQVAIFNLPHPHLRSTIVLLDALIHYVRDTILNLPYPYIKSTVHVYALSMPYFLIL